MVRLTLPVGARDHVRGGPEAPVTLVEYGDFECAACGAAHPILQELGRRLGDRVRFAFRHSPVDTLHPRAARAALAAESAGRQGRFWEMHDLLFENQDALEDVDLLRYAGRLGLEAAAFAAGLDDEDLAARVREDFNSGLRSGVTGTPTFFVKGVRHDGPHHLPALLRALDAAAATP